MGFFDNVEFTKEPTIKKVRSTKKDSYPEWKDKILKDLKRHIDIVSGKSEYKIKPKGSKGKGFDPAYILNLSHIAEDFSLVEITLRYGNERIAFDDAGNTCASFLVPEKARTEVNANKIRVQALNELVSMLESDKFEKQITNNRNEKSKKMKENRAIK